MNLAAPFILRPVATTLVMVAIVLLGVVAYFRLPIASLPNVDRPTIVINAPLPGGDPNTVASSLAQPLERQLGLIPGVVEMTSWSGVGSTEITVQFELSKNIDEAAGAVQAAINAAGPDLPKAYAWPPYFYRSNPAGFAVMSLALTSDVIPANQLYDYAFSFLSPKLSQLNGVAWVNINGAEHSAVRVQVSPGQVANMKLSLEAIRLGIISATQNLPKGAVQLGDQSLPLTANDQLLRASEYRDLTIAWRNGAPVRLGDIANVTDSVINRKVAGWYNNERGVVLYVYKQPDANVVETVDAIKQLLPVLKQQLPPSVKIDAIYDRTTLIRASIDEVQRTIGVAIVLVVLVIAIFLKRFWAAIIPALTIPVVLAATLAVMQVNAYSIDNLTLMALIIAVGFVVDDAVIVIENIMRRIEGGETAMEAALSGSRQMGFTIISISAALIAALIPLLFMSDVVGRYLREFGVALVAAIVASAFVSLTLTPVMCSRLLGQRDHVRPKGRSALFGRFYGRTLDIALRYRGLMFVAIVLITATSVWLYVTMPKAFMPTQDTGVMFVRTIAEPNISFANMEERQRVVINRILQDAAVSRLSSWISDGSGGALSLGSMIVALKPLDERKLDIQRVIARLRASISDIRGMRILFTPFQDLNIGTQSAAARYQYTMWGTNNVKVLAAADDMFERVRALPQVTDVISSWETTGLQAGLTIDRHRAGMLGVTASVVDSTLNDAFAQRQLNTLYLRDNFSRVILEVDPAAQTDPAVFQQLYVPGGGGIQVPLSAITRPRRAHANMWIRHSMQFPSQTISFDTKPGVSIGEAIDAIKAAQAEARLPDEVRAEFRGEAAEAAKTGGRQIWLFVIAIAAIYIVLGMLYESYAHPLTILSVLPPTAFGALLALRITGLPFTVISSIACILVVGMVMKNAIMMVDFALEAQRHLKLAAHEAIALAARQRARPIVMTMLVSALSALPIAVGAGPGYELRQPIGITVVGGLIAAQLVTLYTTPVMYLLMESLRQRLSAVRQYAAQT